jgi:hypothetical protein
MSNPLTTIETIKLNTRVIDLVQSVEFKDQYYHNKVDGRIVSVVAEIQRMLPGVERSSIQSAVKQLSGRATLVHPTRPVGRPRKDPNDPSSPPKPKLEAPTKPPQAFKPPSQDSVRQHQPSQ